MVGATLREDPEIPPTWQLASTNALDLACGNAVRCWWEENCWYANLCYVCHKTKLSCPWHAPGRVDSSAPSCSILHRGDAGRWKGPRISQVSVDIHQLGEPITGGARQLLWLWHHVNVQVWEPSESHTNQPNTSFIKVRYHIDMFGWRYDFCCSLSRLDLGTLNRYDTMSYVHLIVIKINSQKHPEYHWPFHFRARPGI